MTDDIAKSYIPPPKTLPGFQNAKPTKRKTPVKGGGGMRKRWLDGKDILEWDSQHGRIEKYNSKGKHLGEFDTDNNQTKPADPTRTVTPSRFDKMKQRNPIAYSLSWFSKDDELLVSEEDLPSTPDEIRKWFDLKPDDAACDCYEVTSEQAVTLDAITTHKIDLEKCDYFVDAYDRRTT